MRAFDFDELNSKSKEELISMLIVLSESYNNIEQKVYNMLDDEKEQIQWRWNRGDNLENKLVDAERSGDKVVMARIQKNIRHNEMESNYHEGARYALAQIRPEFLDTDEVERDPLEPKHVEYLGATDDNEVVTH